MIPMVPILIIIIMIGMLVLGLIRPPLTVILPLIGIYVILMLIPYILPNLVINQYLSIKYIILPVIGLAMGYGISILMSRYMNIDVRSLLGLGQSRRGVKKPRITVKQKVEKRSEFKPEELDKLINESISALKLGISSNETLGSWVEYYDGWTDAIIGISRRFMDIKESVETINKEALFLSRIRQYESKALTLGLTLREESAFKRQRKSKTSGEEKLVVYVRPEELITELMNATQLMSGYVDEFNEIFEKLIHDKELAQYMVNSQILVLYVDGIPRKFITINRNG